MDRTTELDTACKVFLQDYDFASLEWDGNELTAYAQNGEPFGAREFITNTRTRRAFEELENLFIGSNLASYRTTR